MPTNLPALPAITDPDELIRQNEERLRKMLGLAPVTDQEQLIRQKVTEGYLPDGMAETINAFLDQSPDPTEALARLNSANFYSQAMGVPLDVALANEESISKAWWGQARTPVSTWESISQAFDAGKMSYQLGMLGYQAMQNGMTPELQAQIDAMYEQMPPPDKFQRSLPVQMLKAAANSLPYTMVAGAGAALTQGAVALASYAFAPTALAMTAVKVVSHVIGMTPTANSMSGLEYLEMVQAGVDPKVAKTGALVSGWLQAAVESDKVKGLVGYDMIGKSLSGRLTKAIGEGILKGQYRQPFIQFMLRQTGRTVAEGLEEGVQKAISIGVQEAVKDISNSQEGKKLSEITWKQVAKQIIDDTIQGALASIPLGIAGEPISIAKDVRTYNEWKAANPAAETKPAEAKQEAKPAPTLPTVPEPERAARFIEQAAEPVPEGVRYQTEQEGDRTILKMGDSKGERINYVRYEAEPSETDDSPGTIRIVNLESTTKPSIAAALMKELAGRYAGWDIQWEPKEANEKAVKDLLTMQNPRGQAAGVQWFEAPYEVPEYRGMEYLKKRLVSRRPDFATPEATDALSFTMSRWAAKLGMTEDEIVDKAFAPEVLGTVGGLQQAQAFGAAKKVDVSGQFKTLIELAPEANFSTFLHEANHAVVNFMLSNRKDEKIGSALSEIETALGVKNGNWNAKFDGWTGEYKGKNYTYLEAFNYALEDYIATGNAPTEEMKPVLQKIAEWIYDIYRGMKAARVNLSPELKSYFDGWTKGETPIIKAQEYAVDPKMNDIVYSGENQNTPEGKDIVKTKFAELRNKWEELGVTLDVFPSENRKKSSVTIKVEKDKRNNGLATKAMQELSSLADELGIQLELSPTSEWGSSKARLIDFYKRFGYVENKGKNKDYRISETMYRIPKTTDDMLFSGENQNTPEEQAAFDSAVKTFGTTSNLREAGYILPDGRMLDFSGRHEAVGYENRNGKFVATSKDYLANARAVDHRQIEDVEGLQRDSFIGTGAIRIDVNAGLIDLGKKPTAQQITILRDLISRNEYIQAQLKDGDRKAYFEMDGGKPTKVLGYINRFYQGEELPSEVLFSGENQNEQGWTYKSESIVSQKMQGPMPGKNVLAMLQSAGVKSDELKWTGLDEFLATDKKLTPQEVKEYIAGNKLQIQEVNRGSPKVNTNSKYYIPEIASAIHDSSSTPGDLALTINNDYTIYKTLMNKFPELKEAENNGEDWGQIVVQSVLGTDTKETKYEQYTLPGGENYREVLFTLPSAPENKYIKVEWKPSGAFAVSENGIRKEIPPTLRDKTDGEILDWANQYHQKDSYTSPHWSEPNVLAHTRLDDRTTPDGKMLFIEEIQSDWHQEGRKKGYIEPLTEQEQKRYQELKAIPNFSRNMEGNQELNRLMQKQQGAPQAPFSKTWPEFVFKRILRMAVEGGYDSVGWTTGEQQAERYDLSKQIDVLYYKKNDNGTYDLSANQRGTGDEIEIASGISESAIESYIGKDAAQKVIEDKGHPDQFSDTGQKFLKGVDLKVGGEGMKGFYDKILVDFANKYGKKWGASVIEVVLSEGPKQHKGQSYNAYFGIEEADEIETVTVHSLPITDPMRESVLEGQPLFSGENTNTPAFREWFSGSKVVDEEGKPLVVYHGTTAKNIDVFKPAVEGNGIYFTSSKDVAESYSGKGKKADTYETYLNFKDPLIVDAEGGYWGDLSKAKVLSQDGTATPWTVSQLFGYQNSFTNALAKKVRTSGFDSIIIKNIHDQGTKIKHQLDASTVYIALDPTQIKSIHNRGTWDANDPRILFSGENTNTPAFREWFSGSKVVDEEGKPLVLYHSTVNEFDSFEVGRESKNYMGILGSYDTKRYAIFATPNPDFSAEYAGEQKGARTMPIYMNLKSPIDMRREGAWWDIADEMDKDGYNGNFVRNGVQQEWELFDDQGFVEWAKKAGYDGAIFIENDENGNEQTTYAAFSPNQIKSAFNRGTWNPDDPRILFSGENTNTPAFREWFSDSKVVDEEGKPLVVYHSTVNDFEAFEVGRPSKNSWEFGDYDTTRYAIFATPNPDFSASYAGKKVGARTMPVYMSMKSPIDLTREYAWWDIADEMDADGYNGNFVRDVQYLWELFDNKKFVEWAMSKGYDGAIYEENDDNSEPQIVYAVFSPEQVKSIFNRGTFDTTDPRILFSGEFENTARQFVAEGRTLDELIAYYEFMDEDRVALGIEDLPEEQRRAWYKAQYEKAMAPAPETAPDLATWVKSLADYAKIKQYLVAVYDEVIRVSEEEQPEPGSDPEEIQAFLAKREQAQSYRTQLADPIIAGALAMNKVKPLSNRFYATLHGIIRKNPEEYARIFGDITGDAKLAEQGRIAESEKYADIPGPEQDTRLSISQKAEYAQQIRDEALAKRVLSGEATNAEVVQHAEKVDAKLKESSKRIAELEGETKAQETEIDAQGRTIADQRSELRKVQTELDGILKRMKQYIAANTEIPPALESQKTSIEKRRDAIRKKLEAAGDWLEIERQIKNATERERYYDTEIQKAKDRGETPDPTDVQARSNARTETRELKAKAESYKGIKNDAKLQTYLAKLEERTKLQDERRLADAEARAAKKLLEYRKALARQIEKSPVDSDGKSHSIDYRLAQQIIEIQNSFNPEFLSTRSQKVVDELREKIANDPTIAAVTNTKWLKRAFGRNLNELSLKELEDTAAQLKYLRDVGKTIYEARVEQRRADNDYNRAQVETALESVKGYEPKTGYDTTVTYLEHMEDKMTRFDYSFTNMRRVARLMDGGVDGHNVELLVNEERRHYRTEMENRERRMKALQTYLKDKKVSDYSKQKIVVPGAGALRGDVVLRKSEMLGLVMALRDENSARAAVFGNFFSQEERDTMDKETLFAEGDRRLALLESAIAQNMTQEDYDFLDGFFTQDAKELSPRLAETVGRVENRIMEKVENYFPILRKGAGKDEQIAAQVAQEALDRISGLRRSPARGMTFKRTVIGPNHQTAIELDLFKVWPQSIARQEHYLAYAEYGKTLDATYLAPGVQETIVNAMGDAGKKYVEEYVAEVKNPQAMNPAWDTGLRMLRGNVGFAYLAFKTSSVLKQLVTSPWPSLAYAGPRLFVEASKAMVNPVGYVRDAERLSTVLRNRTIDQIFDAIKNAKADTKFAEAWQEFEKLGMLGLEWADRTSVAIGWRAIYEQALIEFNGDSQKAIEKADGIILDTQPSARGVDLPPIYRNKNEFTRIVLQFTQALNVVYQNIFKDIPAAVQAHDIKTAVGITVSYAIAGALLTAMTTRPPEDEDDEWKRWLWGGTTQFTDSLPLIGEEVTRLMKYAVTGEKAVNFGDSLLPGASKVFGGMTELVEGDMGTALQKLGEGFGTLAGLPVSAVKEGMRAVSGDTGALLGRPRE